MDQAPPDRATIQPASRLHPWIALGAAEPLQKVPWSSPGAFVLIHDRDRVEAGSRWPRCLAVVSP
jgi:hypothetical protein